LESRQYQTARKLEAVTAVCAVAALLLAPLVLRSQEHALRGGEKKPADDAVKEDSTEGVMVRMTASSALTGLHWRALETKESFHRLVDQLNEELPLTSATSRFIGMGKRQGKVDQYEEALMKRIWREEPKKGTPLITKRDGGKGEPPTYYRPIFAKSSCVICHRSRSGNQDLVEQDLLGVAVVRLPRTE
jgi:hypothetical protein